MTLLHRLVAPARRYGGLLTAMALVAAGIVAFGTSQAQAGPQPVMFGYVPLPANDMQLAMETINAGASPDLRYTVGITNAAAGSTMYYDQWEDGYEADIANPAQSTTLIFGDGNTTNGDAATYCGPACAGDLLPQGAALVMQNDIPTPRNSANQLFDGGDKVASTRGFAITAGGFTIPTGSVLATVVSAYDTSKYANDYTTPVGTDTPVPSGTSDAFNYSGLLIQASADGTVVTVDKNRDGTTDVTQTINEGKTLLVNGGVLQGATVHASKPVMVHEITGDTTATYESRTYNLFSDKVLWSDYMSPAGSSVNNFRTVNFLYNPNASAITVTPTCASCSGTLSLAAHDGAAFTSPVGEAVRFTASGGEHFIAVAGVGAQSGAAPGGSGDSSSSWDWGYSLVPTTQLTTQVVLGWAPGNSNVPPSSPVGDRDDNPVWFTSLNATTLHVDYDGDAATGSLSANDCFGAKHDADIPVAALTSTRIYDGTDGNMTGARVYTCDGSSIAGAWGEDPQNAPTGSPGFDAGYTLIPTTTMLVHKSAALAADANNDGKIGPGDTLTYTVEIADAGSLAFTNVALADTLPAGLTYVPGSTVFDDGTNPPTALSDDTVPPAASAFPLDESGVSLPNIGAGKTVQVRFQTAVDAPYGSNAATITNTACVTASEASACDTSVTPLLNADVSLTKSVTTPATHAGDNVTFRLTASNSGPDDAPAVQVTDLLPAGLTYVSHNASQGSYNPNTGLWAGATIANGGNATLDITATVTATSVTNTAQITNSGAVDPDSTPNNGATGEDDYASAAVNVAPAADLSLAKAVTHAPAFLGDDATFRLTVTNHGPSGATGVAVTDQLPSGLSFSSFTASQGSYNSTTGVWTVGNVANGATPTLDITAQLTTTASVTNTGEITAANELDPDSTPNNASHTEDDWASASVSATGGTIGDRVWNDANGNGAQDSGETGFNGVTATLLRDADTNGSYETTVATTTTAGDGAYSFTNLFPGAYRVVVSTNTLPTGAVCTNCNAVNDPVLAGNATISNIDYGYGVEADLSVTDAVTQTAPHVGDHGKFTIVVANGGPAPATGVVVHNALPAGTTFVGATASQGTYNNATGQWTVGNLPVSGGATLTVEVVVNSAAAATDTAEVSAADQSDPDSTPNNHNAAEDDQDAATLSPSPVIDLELSEDASATDVNVGHEVVFTLHLHNDGPSDATGVVVDDKLPAGFTFVSATPAVGTYDATTGHWTVGTLAANHTTTLILHATVAKAGALHNPAQVVAATEHDVDSQPAEDALGTPNQDDEATATVTGVQIDLAVDVTAAKPTVNVGGTETWTVTLHNAGPSDATGVKVTDALPDGVTLLQASADKGTYDAATDTWVVGAVAKNGTATLVLTTTVTKAGQITDAAEVSAANEPDVDSTPANHIATEDDQDAATVTSVAGDVPGTLWVDSNNNGIVDNGEPRLGGVRIELLDDAGNVVAAAVTDSVGDYMFPNVAPGVYTVSIDKTTVPATVAGLVFDADGILDGLHTVVVTAAATAPSNFGYTMPAPADDPLPRTGENAPLGLSGGLLAIVLATRSRRRLRNAER